MDDVDYVKEITQAWNLFSTDLGLGRSFICRVLLPVDEEFRRVALTPESSYARIYREGLSRSAYNFILMDYSYFQFTWESRSSWRMAYFPNPWITGVAGAQRLVQEWEMLEDMGGLTHEEGSELIEELPYMGAVPPIRFEYSGSQYREVAHPAAHFHVGRNADNRWPCALLLGPMAFSMMIARLYYPEKWQERSSFSSGHPPTECLDLKFTEVIARSQSVHQFSAPERRMLHIGRNMIGSDISKDLRAKRNGQLRRRT